MGALHGIVRAESQRSMDIARVVSKSLNGSHNRLGARRETLAALFASTGGALPAQQ